MKSILLSVFYKRVLQTKTIYFTSKTEIEKNTFTVLNCHLVDRFFVKDIKTAFVRKISTCKWIDTKSIIYSHVFPFEKTLSLLLLTS